MSNNYILRMKVIGKFHEVKIDKERFEKLKMAGKILSNALSIEQVYAIVVSNFFELERENVARSSNVSGSAEYKDASEILLALNIRLINFLTAVCSYKDQLPKYVRACVPSDKNAKKDIQDLFSQEKKTPEYYFMEQLRNHAIHCGVPVHWINIHGERIGAEKKLEFSLSFYAEQDMLSFDRNADKSMLEKMPKKVNLLAAARVYVEAVSKIHEQVREKTKVSVDSARVNMDDAISEYRKEYKEEIVGLYALAYQDKKKIDEVSIITKWDDVRIGLVAKNKKIVNLSGKYVSSRADK